MHIVHMQHKSEDLQEGRTVTLLSIDVEKRPHRIKNPMRFYFLRSFR